MFNLIIDIDYGQATAVKTGYPLAIISFELVQFLASLCEQQVQLIFVPWGLENLENLENYCKLHCIWKIKLPYYYMFYNDSL